MNKLICFEESEQIEFVIENNRLNSENDSLRKAILEHLGVPFGMLENESPTSRDIRVEQAVQKFVHDMRRKESERVMDRYFPGREKAKEELTRKPFA